MNRIRLQKWGKGRTETEYTVTLDGVPLGCDGLFNDPALVIFVGQEVAKEPHRIAKDGAMVFEYCRRMDARRASVKALKEYEDLQAERDKGVHFDREEAAKLRELAEYCMRGYMGEHHKTIMMILRKVGGRRVNSRLTADHRGVPAMGAKLKGTDQRKAGARSYLERTAGNE